MKMFVGIDNGVTGSVGIISENGESLMFHTPVKKELNYTKVKRFLNRVDAKYLKEILSRVPDDSFVMIERPMVNPMRFQATLSAVRCLEATLTVLELFGLPYSYIDSKEWQSALLPSGLAKEELKTASKSVASRLFPKLDLSKFDDGDGILIAEFNRRKRMGLI